MTALKSTALPPAEDMQPIYESSKTEYAATILDSFLETSVNGEHRCFVLELVGPTLECVISQHTGSVRRRMGTNLILKVAKQLLCAVLAFHEIGCVHRGMHSQPST